MKKDYNGWLGSNSFWKRAIAVWAYAMIIPGILYLLFLFLGLFFFLFI